MRIPLLILAVSLCLSACKNEPTTGLEENISKLKQDLELRKKEIADQKEIARLEAELQSLENDLQKVGGKSESSATPPPAAKPGPGTATIKGSNVNMRGLASVQSPRIASLNKGEVVQVIEVQQSDKANEGILVREVPLFSNDTETGKPVFTLPKGKAVVIEGLDEPSGKINVSYQHPQKGKLYAQIDEASFESIENGAWFKVKRGNGQMGWVYEQFIKVN